ncbi:hypothetical protein F4776DRAFT_661123 [Hypoxylon sp. NC0597]|nr:hypothetical protein F4776DRAFT_661123 [Hypoxylon sp. NC0597]
MHSVRFLLVLAWGMAMVGSSVGDESPVSKDETIPYTFQPGSDFSGSLTVQPNQALEYFKNEVGIDIDKVLSHPELFPASSGGNYTFPNDSGVEGTIFWNLTDHSSSSVTAPQRMTCAECEAVCSLWYIPFMVIA